MSGNRCRHVIVEFSKLGYNEFFHFRGYRKQSTLAGYCKGELCTGKGQQGYPVAMPWRKEIQQQIAPSSALRRKWFSNKIICKDEGWSFWMTSSGAGRIDAFHYEENARELTLGGEGLELMDVIIPAHLAWDDALSTPIEDSQAKRILRNITAAIQRCGFSVSFSYLEDAEEARR